MTSTQGSPFFVVAPSCGCERIVNALRRRTTQRRNWRSLGSFSIMPVALAASVAGFRGLIIDRFAFTARLQMQRRAAVVAELRTGRIEVLTEEALGKEHVQHPDAR